MHSLQSLQSQTEGRVRKAEGVLAGGRFWKLPSAGDSGGGVSKPIEHPASASLTFVEAWAGHLCFEDKE